MISNGQELIQSDPTVYHQNQKGNKYIHKLTAVLKYCWLKSVLRVPILALRDQFLRILIFAVGNLREKIISILFRENC